MPFLISRRQLRPPGASAEDLLGVDRGVKELMPSHVSRDCWDQGRGLGGHMKDGTHYEQGEGKARGGGRNGVRPWNVDRNIRHHKLEIRNLFMVV